MELLKMANFFIAGFVVICTIMFLFSTTGGDFMVGKAFYLSDGTMNIAEPGEPLPEEIKSINTQFWGISLVVFLALLITVNLIASKKR